MATSKTLGKKSARLITTLLDNHKPIFTISDVQRILNYTYPIAKDLLHKLKNRNIIDTLKPGVYVIIPQELGGVERHTINSFVLAREITRSKKHYISHYSAMDFHNMVTQPVTTTYVTTDRITHVPKLLRNSLIYVYTKPDRIWGVEERWVTESEKVRVSDLERTIVDCLWLPKYAGGISEVSKGIWIQKERINTFKLLEYTRKFNKFVVTKRVGFIFELFGIGDEDFLFRLRENINERYDRLDPNLPDMNLYKNRWNLRVNVSPEELEKIIAT